MTKGIQTLDLPIELDGVFDNLFDDRWEVIILDSPYTTFAEVENACIDLFSFTKGEAHTLALKVHNVGQAVAAIMSEEGARKAAVELTARNVKNRIQRI